MFVLSTKEFKSGDKYCVRVDFMLRNKKYFVEDEFIYPNWKGKTITEITIENLKKYCINNL